MAGTSIITAVNQSPLRCSQASQAIARAELERAMALDDGEKKDAVSHHALQDIYQHTSSTADEKLLSRWGLDQENFYVSPGAAAEMRMGILNALATPVAGPLSAIVAGIYLNAVNGKSISVDQGVTVAASACSTILNNPSSSDDEKSLARLGLNVNDPSNLIFDRTKAAINTNIMTLFISPVPGPAGTALAAIAYDSALSAFKDSMGHEQASDICRAAFKTILDDPRAGESQKALAAMGTELHDNILMPFPISREGLSSARLYLTKALATPFSLPVEEAVSRATLGLARYLYRLEDIRSALFFAIRQIYNNPQVSGNRRHPAELFNLWAGTEGFEKTFKDPSIERMMVTFLERMSAPAQQPLSKDMAEWSLWVGALPQSKTTEGIVYKEGLLKIMNSTEVDENVRAYVRQELEDKALTGTMDPGAHAAEMKALLERVLHADGLCGSRPQSGDAPRIEVDEQFVDIGGIKLDIRGAENRGYRHLLGLSQ